MGRRAGRLSSRRDRSCCLRPEFEDASDIKKLLEASERGRKSEAEDELDLDRVLITGQSNGLTFDAMMNLTVGSIVDYCIENQNQRIRAEKEDKKGGRKRKATQAEYDAFFG